MKKGFIQHQKGKRNGAGFTLVEILVVMVIFAGLMMAGTNLFFQVVMSANRATTETELRQNTSLLMETITRDIRRSACYQIPSQPVLNLYLDATCSQLLASYDFGGPVTIISNKVLIDPGPSGFFSEGANTVRIVVKLNMVNAQRADFSGTQIATQSVSLRQISF